ncbi:MAG TPA: hypothetical protein VMZ69_11440, partial [Saprospiraceae bacterium]|nr:hypothetical protein [Saprospiraceae bacterium]
MKWSARLQFFIYIGLNQNDPASASARMFCKHLLKQFIILLFLFGSNASLHAQKSNNFWYFGNNAGINFNSSPPTALSGSLSTLEGTSSISDPDGNLLFYTNGATAWDRNHNVMPNGDGLIGGESSSQVLIVPFPNSCSKYFLFTTQDHSTDGGLHYSIVDMCLNDGYGDIVSGSKNKLVYDRTTENLTAVLHANKRDIWIISHRLNSNQFLSFHVSPTGVNTTPVASSIGAFYPSNANIGVAKASHDGKKIVSVSTFHSICQMFDFDNATGKLSGLYDFNQLFSGQRWFYGIEFSPNDDLLYLSTTFVNSILYQINLSTKDVVTLNSKSGNYHYGALQMGTDKKIYMARNNESFLDVINSPNSIGAACQYEEKGFSLLNGTSSTLGLPNFAPYSFFIDFHNPDRLGNDTTICIGSDLTLQPDLPLDCDPSIIWSDGSTNDQLVVSSPGTYWLHGQNDCVNFDDTISVAFEVCQQECSQLSGIIFGSDNGDERGYSLAPTEDNNGFYVGGFKNDSVSIIKMDLHGRIEWYRTIDVGSGVASHLTRIMLDSDGMLVLAGTHGGFPYGNSIFVIRYDPDINQILWSKKYRFTPQTEHYSLLQKGGNGNFVISLVTVYSNPQTDNSNVIEIDKSNGNLMSSLSAEYDLGASDGLAEIVYHNGFIYGTGRYTDGGGPPDMRNTIAKLNANDGSQVWVKMGHISGTQTARLYGADLIIHEDNIYSIYFGDPGGTSLTNNILYVQQTDLDGKLVWLRSYNIPGVTGDSGIELISSDGGLVILAKERPSTSAIVLFKIDLQGMVLWAHSYKAPDKISTFGEVESARSSQMIQVKDKIILTAFGTNGSGGTNSVVLITNLNGEFGEGCIESSPVQITSATISNPVFYNVSPSMANVQPVVTQLSAKSRDSSPIVQCKSVEVLNDEVTVIICAGDTYNGYTTTGTYIDTFTTNRGCDSIRTLHLTITPSVATLYDQTICLGENYEGYNASGMYVDTFALASGCDSIRTLHLTVHAIQSQLEITLCEGSNFEGYDQQGLYIDTLDAITGCDTIRMLDLSFYPATATFVNHIICEGDSYFGYSTTGIYTDTFSNVIGCDSVRILDLTTSSHIIIYHEAEICFGDEYNGHSQAGIYADTVTSVFGCDSITITTLTIVPVVKNENVEICYGAAFD